MKEYKDLPSELIDMIFDELWNGLTWDDPPREQILQNCLPVSTDFRHRILSRFCSDVSLVLEPDYMARLSKVISQPANSRLGGIGRYIKHFTLHCYDILNYGLDTDFHGIVPFFDSEDVVVILEGLHGEYFGVEEFSLNASGRCEDTIPWVDIPASFQSAFRSLIHSPRLTRLNIRDISFPSEPLFSGSHLKTLTIRAGPLFLPASPPRKEICQAPFTASALPFPALLELNTDHSHECDSNFLPPLMLEKLEVFKETPNSRLHSEKTWRILGLSASSLTEIYISHMGAVVKPPEAFNLGIVHNLKVFEYSRRSQIWGHFDSPNDETPSILFQLFNTAESMKYLKSIKINFDLRDNLIDEFFMDSTITHSGWASLDRVLTGPHFPCLRHFEILISVTAVVNNLTDFNEDSFSNTTKNRLKTSFSRIVGSETINFELPVRVSRLPMGNDFFNNFDIYSNGNPSDHFDMYYGDDGYEIDHEWDYESLDDEFEGSEEEEYGDEES